MNKYVKYIILGIIAVAISSLLFQPKEDTNTFPQRDYAEIIQSGILRAVTEYNSVNYHANGDSMVGFHFELLKAFAENKGLSLEVVPIMSMDERMKGINNGKFDILANDVLITTDRKDSLLYTHPILLGKQILVQRKPFNEKDSNFIHSQLDLAHKTLHIVKGSPHKFRIMNLSNEIGDTIYIKEIDKYGPEQLLAMVAHGDIDYAVCDESIAKSLQNDFPQLHMTTNISFSQFYSWGVSKNNIVLLDTLNTWLEKYTQTRRFKELKKTYHKE